MGFKLGKTISKFANNPLVKYNPVFAPLTIASALQDKDYQGKEKKAALSAADELQQRKETLFGGVNKTLPQDITDIRNLAKERTKQADPVSEAIRNSKAGAVATAQRNMAGAGVKGGSAMMAAQQAGRQKDMDVAASLYGQQANSLETEREVIGNIITKQNEMDLGSAQARAAANAPKKKGLFGFA
jgi:hypothetical protein